MSDPFDSDAIAQRGWRQGAVLGPELAKRARELAPDGLQVNERDWLIVTSHDCDIVNTNIEKEPVVEVVHARVVASKKPDKQQAWGRNPRTLELVWGGDVLSMSVHGRWVLPRQLLMKEEPSHLLPVKERRLIAEWLAKRYIRSAFPTAFDLRWRSKLKEWQKLLRRHSEWLQGVYLRLSTMDELPDTEPYQCHLILGIPHDKRGDPAWPSKRQDLEDAVTSFWEQFDPSIALAGVEVLGTDEITLADLEPYQRFDADWVSFEDETATPPATADMAS
jgi:hypothetical protein